MKSLIPVVVFADVDQTFLANDRPLFSCDVGELLAGEGITLVLSSSMTRAELEMCQQDLGIRQPFICESGAAVLVPHDYFPFDVPCDRELTGYHLVEFGVPYSEVVAVLHRVTMRLGVPVVGFSDLSVEQVASQCGLSLSHARLAKLREYNEPFRLVDAAPDARSRLRKALHAARLACTYHAPFDHVGAQVDKEAAVRLLTGLYRRLFGTLLTIGPSSPPNVAAPLRSVTNRGKWLESVVDRARRIRERRPLSRVSAAR